MTGQEWDITDAELAESAENFTRHLRLEVIPAAKAMEKTTRLLADAQQAMVIQGDKLFEWRMFDNR